MGQYFLTSHPLSVSASQRLCQSADRVGFQPTKRLPVYALSRRVPSAARPPIQTTRRVDGQTHRRVVNTRTGPVSLRAALPRNPSRRPAYTSSQLAPPTKARSDLMNTLPTK